LKYVLSSWKMYPTVGQAQASFDAIQRMSRSSWNLVR